MFKIYISFSNWHTNTFNKNPRKTTMRYYSLIIPLLIFCNNVKTSEPTIMEILKSNDLNTLEQKAYEVAQTEEGRLYVLAINSSLLSIYPHKAEGRKREFASRKLLSAYGLALAKIADQSNSPETQKASSTPKVTTQSIGVQTDWHTTAEETSSASSGLERSDEEFIVVEADPAQPTAEWASYLPSLSNWFK